MRKLEFDQRIARTVGIILAGAAMSFGAETKPVSAGDSQTATATATPTRVLITPTITPTPDALAIARANVTALAIELNRKREIDALNGTAVVLSSLLTKTPTKTPPATWTLTITPTGTPLPTGTRMPTETRLPTGTPLPILSRADGTATSEARIDAALGKEMAQGKMTATAEEVKQVATIMAREAKTATAEAKAEAKNPSPTTEPTPGTRGSSGGNNQGGGLPWEVPTGLAVVGIAGRELYRRNTGAKGFMDSFWAATKAVAGVLFRRGGGVGP